MNKRETYEFFKNELMKMNKYSSESQITPEDDYWISESTEHYLDMISNDNY